MAPERQAEGAATLDPDFLLILIQSYRSKNEAQS